MNFIRWLVIGCISGFFSCNQPNKMNFENGDLFFQVIENKEYTKIVLKQPDEEKNIYLSKHHKDSLNEINSIHLTIPLKNVVITSATYVPPIEMLGELDAIKGFPNPNYVYSERFRELVKNGKIKDIGIEERLDVEKVLLLQPEVIFAYQMGEKDHSLIFLEKQGIPVIYIQDFMAQSPLERIQWLKFFGYLFDKTSISDSLIQSITYHYNNVKNKITNGENKPNVFSGIMYNGIWYLPGNKNYMATIYRDAGADYTVDNDSSAGWVHLNFEKVFRKHYKSEFWIGVGSVKNKQQLLDLDKRYVLFSAFKNNGIYQYDARMHEDGSLDYLESALYRPDVVLADLGSIFHPELFPNHSLYYFRKLP